MKHEGTSDVPVSFDALLPPAVAERAERAGAEKARLTVVATLMLAILAGAFIGLGAAFSTVAITGAADLPWGVTRVLAGVTFSLGLILVIVGGAELFTGNNLLVMAFVSRRVTVSALARNWTIVYLGNFIGSIATAGLIVLSAQYLMADGQLGLSALRIAAAKCELPWGTAFIRGIYCNALVCLAVWLCYSCRGTGEKILAIVFPITAFVAAGFEHSIANMYFIPVGLFIQQVADGSFWMEVGAGASDFDSITWRAFVGANLVPVTLGNIVGGSGFVGLVYWVIYRRGQGHRG